MKIYAIIFAWFLGIILLALTWRYLAQHLGGMLLIVIILAIFCLIKFFFWLFNENFHRMTLAKILENYKATHFQNHNLYTIYNTLEKIKKTLENPIMEQYSSEEKKKIFYAVSEILENLECILTQNFENQKNSGYYFGSKSLIEQIRSVMENKNPKTKNPFF